MMARGWILAGAVTAATALAGGGAAAREEAEGAAQVTGVVTYRERVALPPDATIQIRLEDVSRPEMPGRVVAKVTVPTEGRQVPIPFTLPYSAADIVATKRYVVRATVAAGGKTLFASRSLYPVITRGAPTKLEILVQAAAGEPRPRATPAVVALEGTYWTLVELAGKATPAAPPGGREAHLVLDAEKGSFEASTGCNSVSGNYARPEAGLTLTSGPMTMMACPDDAMRQEAAFLEALRATTGFRIAGDDLALLGGERVVAKFVAARPAPAPQAH